MAHAREQIRVALAQLLTGLSITQSRVYTSRNIVLQDSELPAIEITTNDEQVSFVDIHSSVLERNLSIDLIAKVKAVDNVDDLLDDIIGQIEARINASTANRTLNGLCQGLDLTSIEIGIDESLATPVGQAVLRYQAQYHTNPATPEIIL
jgi:hypothetical protein